MSVPASARCARRQCGMPPVREPSDPPRNDEEENFDLNDFLADIGLPVLCGLGTLVLLLLAAVIAVLL